MVTFKRQARWPAILQIFCHAAKLSAFTPTLEVFMGTGSVFSGS